MAEATQSKAERRRLARIEETVTALAALEAERQIKAKETPRDRAARESQEQTIRRIVDNLEELGGKMFDDDDIVFFGKQLILPETMSISQGRKFLEQKEQDEERETAYDRTFMYRPWDGAYCMWQVMKRTFGAVSHRDTIRYTMFGQVTDPPQMHSINVDVGKREQVPWGTFEIPFIPGTYFETSGEKHPQYGPLFKLTANGPKKNRFKVEGVFNLVEEELKTNSLYRGKAFDGQTQPEFMDVWSIDRRKVVYSEDVLRQLEASVWGQLRHTSVYEKNGIPLKRAVLLHGPFGTGKTLALMLTGQEAVQNNWTFIMARPGRDDLSVVLQTARLYQPCVVAYEDLDAIASANEDDRATVSKLLDDFDGLDAKGTKVLAVLTTNYPERIRQGMTRPGRLDALIEINELDEHGVSQLVKVRIPESTLDPDIDWSAVFADAEGYKPAFVTEFADRAMRYVINRSKGSLDGQTITTEDLCLAARGLRPQFELMQEAKDTPGDESLGTALQRRVEAALEEQLNPQLLAKNQ